MHVSSVARRALLLSTLAACAGDAPATSDTLVASPRVPSTGSPDVAVVPRGADTALADTALPRAITREHVSGRSALPPAASPSAARAMAPAGVDSSSVDSAASEPVATAADSTPHTPRSTPPSSPFAVGERLAYEVRFGPVRIGGAVMELRGRTEVRGEPAYHAVFAVTGGNQLYRVNDHYESWFSARSGSSLRYEQRIDQGSYERLRRYEIFPERRTFRQEGKPAEEPSVAEPLDEASFLYFLRTVPLEVGRSYAFDRYFRPDRNPVTVRVLRRERVTVPAGTFDAVVVQPTIRTPGIFSEGGRAEVWFADDSTRRILQIRSRLKFGTISLHLK